MISMFPRPSSRLALYLVPTVVLVPGLSHTLSTFPRDYDVGINNQPQYFISSHLSRLGFTMVSGYYRNPDGVDEPFLKQEAT